MKPTESEGGEHLARCRGGVARGEGLFPKPDTTIGVNGRARACTVLAGLGPKRGSPVKTVQRLQLALFWS